MELRAGGVPSLRQVFAGAGSYGSPQTFVDGFAPAVIVGAGLSLAGALFRPRA